MNRTIILSTAAAAIFLVPPLEAKPDRNQGSASQPPPPAKQEPRVATQAQALFDGEPRQRARAPSRFDRSATVTNAQSFQFQKQSRPAPTIAFGGSASRNTERTIIGQNGQRFGSLGSRSQSFGRNDFRHVTPPVEVFRNWDRRLVHSWNHHRFRWYGNDWVTIDGGFDAPYYYGSVTPEPVEYGVPDDLASAVQEELTRRGYDPGGVDGVIGPQTRSAIVAFQEDRDLPVTGRIDRSLLRALGLQ
jgi:hypothetical protein